ncbi:MAG: ferritin-like domain-containing protein [Limisphaerales bacterium]
MKIRTLARVAGHLVKQGVRAVVKRVTKPTDESLEGVDWERWAQYFRRNREQRVEPDWDKKTGMQREGIRKLLPSLQQFELGDGGGPACLIAFNAEDLRDTSVEIKAVIDAWFDEEREHSRLLGAAVERFGGRHLKGHWSHTAFCAVRKTMGVRFELQVLLLTEIVSAAYYRVLRRHAGDQAMKDMCSLILRDESGHIAFHLDRLEAADKSVLGLRRKVWEAQFWMFGYMAAGVLWANHGPCLRPLGATNAEYLREVRRRIFRFVAGLKRRAIFREVSPALA